MAIEGVMDKSHTMAALTPGKEPRYSTDYVVERASEPVWT
jgi:hypothetical protein